MDLRVINKRIIFQRMRKKRSKTLLSFFIQQQNWTGIQDANLTSVEFLIHRELPHYQLLCWVKWSSHLIRTCKLSYIPDWLYKVMICRVLISSNVRKLGFVKSHHMPRRFALSRIWNSRHRTFRPPSHVHQDLLSI